MKYIKTYDGYNNYTLNDLRKKLLSKAGDTDHDAL